MKRFDWQVVSGDYYTRKKLKSGKTALVCFYQYKSNDWADREFVMSFVITNKRKSLLNLDHFDDRMTGDGSLEGLAFARDALLDFENSINKNCIIIIGGSDSRRQRVYERYLVRFGYKKEIRYGQFMMVKRVSVL